MAQRILLHLSLFARYREEYECPQEVTQQGIASSLVLSRSHVALELKKLLAERKVEWRLAHVRGAKSRRKVYFTTPSGERVAFPLRDRACSSESRWIDPEGRLHQGPGVRLIQLSRRVSRPLTSIYEGLLRGDVVDLREAVRPPSPLLPRLVGREGELARLRAWLDDGAIMFVVTGLPGIGKTTLAEALFQEVEDGFWVKVFPFHTPSSLLASIAHGLASQSRPRLLSYLKSGPVDFAEVGILLSREASGMLVVFDDVTSSPSASQVLRLMIDNPAPGCKILLTGRRMPEFLRAEDRVGGVLEELQLGGLTLEDTRELLQSMGRQEELERIHELTGGHPLLLKLTATTAGVPGEGDVTAFLLDEVLASLEPRGERILMRASVYRKPFPKKALGNVGVRVVRSLLQAGLLSLRGGLYEVHDIVAPLIRRHSDDGLQDAHLRAARYWQSRGEWMEALHHLAVLGRTKQFLSLARKQLDEILEAGHATELLRLLEELPAGSGPTLFYVRARALDYLGQWTQALLSLEEGLRDPGRSLRVPLLLLWGRVHSKRGDFTEAEKAFEAARHRAEEEGRDVELGKALYGLGIVHRKMGRMSTARSLMEKALDAFKASGAEKETKQAEMEMGVIHLQSRNPAEAVPWFKLAMPHSSTRKVDAAYVYNNLGIAYSELKKVEESLKAFEESVRLAEEAGMLRAEGYALVNASDLLAEKGQIERALDYCQRSFRIFSQLGDPVMISACYANRAKATRVKGDLVAAEKLYEESFKALDGTNAPYSLATRWLEASELYEQMGEPGRAEEFRSRAMEVLKGEGNRPPEP